MNAKRIFQMFLLATLGFALAIGGCRCRSEHQPAPEPAVAPGPAAHTDPTSTVGTGMIHLTVSGLRNEKGQVMAAIYNDQEGFPSDAEKAFQKQRSPITGSSVTFRFQDVPYGTYAVSVLHDENLNGAVDKNFLGIPREGAGASNNPKQRFGPPRYEDARFTLSEPTRKINVTVNYP